MENHRRITEEDLLVTEALIAQSYRQLKRSVIQVPSRAYHSVGQTLRDHPYATAGTAVVAGVALYGIFKIMTSHASVQEAQGRERIALNKDTSGLGLIQHMLPMLVPLVAPYITGYIQKYLGRIQSGERD
jgi:hypothetical protein